MFNQEEILEEFNHLILLFSLYENLLTQNQRICFGYYYDDNYTMQEIASELGISKSAVHDTLNKTINHLKNYENVLKLLDKKNKRLQYLDQLPLEVKNLDIIKKLRKLDE